MALESLKRNGHRLELGNFEKEGEYGIPVLEPEHLDTRLTWIRFNHALKLPNSERGKYGIHFFIDDYLFERVWHDPTRYALFLRDFPAVMSPDFSMFTDWPKAVQIYNHFRKHQLGAYWQHMGIKVIPTICWSDAESFEWCLDGEPVGGTIAISSVGTQRYPEAKEFFVKGYNTIMERLKPKKIIFFGTVPPECTGNIESHAAYYTTLSHAQKTQKLSGLNSKGEV